MARRFSRSRFIRPAPRTKMWIGNTLSVQTVAANTAVLLGVLSASALLLRPFTILRTRVLVGWSTDNTTGSEEPTGVYGEIVVTDSASAAGVASIPDPITEPTAAWFIYQPLLEKITTVTAVGIQRGGGGGYNQYMVDSKSMRKVGPDDDIVSIGVNNNASHGALLVTVGRQLIQLH